METRPDEGQESEGHRTDEDVHDRARHQSEPPQHHQQATTGQSPLHSEDAGPAAAQREPGRLANAKNWRDLWDENRELRNQIQKLRDRIRELQGSDAAVWKARRMVLREMAILLPSAVKMAKQGKPALLRLISRTLK
jgi:hypothetical protein